MKISKKETFSAVKEDEEEREILYCPYCSRYDISSVLHFRTAYNEVDKELWRECDSCKRILPASSGKKHGRLSSNIEPIDNVFDKATITGLGNKRTLSYMEKYKQQLRKKAAQETDEEVRREILKGNEITEGVKKGSSYVDG